MNKCNETGRAGQTAPALLLALFTVTTAYAAESAFPVAATSPLVFQQVIPGLTDKERLQFSFGRGLFDQVWTASPSVNPDVDGLGPTFNQSSCAACHARNGRGQPPNSPQERLRGALVRLSVPGVASKGGPLPHPVYGDQLQDSSISGVPAEGRVHVSWSEHEERFTDGSSIHLRKPQLTLSDLVFGDAGKDLLMSLRVAPQIVGAGLLDAVPDAVLEMLAQQARPDGISGRVNHVFDVSKSQVVAGHFGWKANAGSLLQQTAGAFSGDLGITSTFLPNENCPAVQTACAQAPASPPDVTTTQLQAIVFYQATLAVPPRRMPTDASVRRGEQLFTAAGCQHCHLPAITAGSSSLHPLLANQRIAAYTDLLVHDMGDELADGRPDFQASGSEWRTPPLWGIGLVNTVNEHDTLLHDGRARGVLEAIMWHGGEAKAARERVRAMAKPERDALVNFVNSL